MTFILPICLVIVWGAMLYGFLSDDMDWGFFGRLYAALAHGAITILAMAAIGGLVAATILAFKELV